MGHKFGEAFRLVGNIESLKFPSNRTTLYVGQLKPIYWISEALLLSMNMSAQHQQEHSQYATANLLWYATPNLSIMPRIQFGRIDAFDTYSSYNNATAGVTTTYHIDNNWASSAAVVGLGKLRRRKRVFTPITLITGTYSASSLLSVVFSKGPLSTFFPNTRLPQGIGCRI